jgi:DNA-binding transcriptional MerR regulator
MNVTHLARKCGLSRSTLLYYESIGLMKPPVRTGASYRQYSEADLQRLRQVCLYRSAGLKLADIRCLLDRRATGASSILKRRLVELDAEIEKLRSHQRAIVRLLQQKNILRRNDMITKDKWVSIMRATGFTDQDLHRWHAEFERSAPDEHQEFLEFLHILPDEIRGIREWSRKGAK